MVVSEPEAAIWQVDPADVEWRRTGQVVSITADRTVADAVESLTANRQWTGNAPSTVCAPPLAGTTNDQQRVSPAHRRLTSDSALGSGRATLDNHPLRSYLRV
jgi:hypothetical protein